MPENHDDPIDGESPLPPGRDPNFVPPGRGGTPPGLAKKNKVPPGHDPNHPRGKDTDGVIDPDDVDAEPGEPFQPDTQEPVADPKPQENPNPTT